MRIEFKGWYFRILVKDKKRFWTGGAFWPIILVEDINNDGIEDEREIETTKHEQGHLKQQIELLLLGWLVLYIYFYFARGYTKNPFELEAEKWEKTTEKRPWFSYGWTKYLNNENRRKK